MYPELLHIGPMVITSFGAMVALGALLGLWLLRHEVAYEGLPAGVVDIAAIGVLAGLAGAKLLWMFEHRGEEPLFAMLTSRGGLSWFGGFAAGVGLCVWLFRRNGWPVIPILAAATPALALGHVVGRLGCFLVGDD